MYGFERRLKTINKSATLCTFTQDYNQDLHFNQMLTVIIIFEKNITSYFYSLRASTI
jgi:hypothetical protein